MGCSSSFGLTQSTLNEGQNNVVITHDTQLDNVTISVQEKRLIQKTWKQLSKNMPEIGAKIFLQIFSLYPHVKQLFPCRDVTGDALLQDPHFKGHASRFMQAVGAAVDNIDDLDAAMAPLLFGLGQQHIHFKGFLVDYFDAFTESITRVWKIELGSLYTIEVANVWRRIFVYMMNTLKLGYQDALGIAK